MMTEQNTGPGTPGGKPLSILVVEDNAINLQLINTLLLRLGHTVESTQDGADAVEKFRTNRYDIILMDVMMPVMDGVTATTMIREIEAGRKSGQEKPVYIIAVTANSYDEDRDACIKAGMNDFLGKPLRFNELRDMINALSLQP